MKKMLTLILAAALLLTALPAGADELIDWVRSGEYLFFETENVTLKGNAVFTLDGERFKTAEAEYRQNGTDSFWKLDLLTPREANDDRLTGYTVVRNGDELYVMENFTPGLYRKSYTYLEDTNPLIRRTVRNQVLADAAAAMIREAETMLPVTALISTDAPGEPRKLIIHLEDGETPALMNAAVNLAAQYAIQRYFGVNGDDMPDTGSVLLSHYLTPTEAICYASRRFEIITADVSLAMNGESRLTGAKGAVTFRMITRGGSIHELGVTFEVEVSAYGETQVEAFDPEAYGVVEKTYHDLELGEEYGWEDFGGEEAPEEAEETPEESGEAPEEAGEGKD